MGNNTSSYLNLVQGHNITNIKNFGAIFKDTLDVKFIAEKNRNLKKLTTDMIKMPKIEDLKKVTMTNDEYLYLLKNFINYYNENNKNRMNFLKKSLGIKFYLNDKYILYFVLFFCEFEDYKRNAKSQNIMFMSLSDNSTTFKLDESVLYSKIIGQWGTSDIVMGNESEFKKIRFIDIFKDYDIKYVLEENDISKLLDNKEYITQNYYERGFPPEKKFKTLEPQYINPKKLINIKLGNKCLSIDKNNKINMDTCKNNTAKFKLLENNKLQYNNTNTCVAFHDNKELSLVPCDSLNNCDSSSNLQSCQLFRPRKYGGLEIVGKKNKCLSSNLKSTECYKTDKFNYL